MSRTKKEPDYNSDEVMQELIMSLAKAYEHTPSLRTLANEFNITLLKTRKLLITAGVFSSEISETVNALKKEEKSIEEIMDITGLSRASVHSYLPYSKTVYNTNERTLAAERVKTYRERKVAAERLISLENEDASQYKELLWNAIAKFENYPFSTAKGLRFKYTVKGNEMFVNRKEKSITRATVNLAFEKVLKLQGVVTGPKKLGVFGASYLYPVFVKLGVIAVPKKE